MCLNVKHLYLFYQLHHELTLCNLLETILYHEDACQCTGDAVNDLIDYCSRVFDASIAKT